MTSSDHPGALSTPRLMRAAVVTAFGPPEVVRIAEVPMPQVGDHDVLIRTAATTVSSADWRIRARAMPRGFGLMSRLALGFRGPRRPILGTELSGTVVEIGKAVTRFRPGDDVVGYPATGLACHAEYRSMHEDGLLILKPAALNHAEAAALSFGGTTALYFLRDKGRIREGHRILVIGASGSVGSAAVQIARHFGAIVTGVCSSPNADLVRRLGAHDMIDYTSEDWLRTGSRFDLILDTIGVETISRACRALHPDGRFLMVAADLPQMLAALAPRLDRRKAMSGLAPERTRDMQLLADLAGQGAFRPLVDRIYPLEEIAAAHRRVESRRKRGNVVVALDPALVDA